MLRTTPRIDEEKESKDEEMSEDKDGDFSDSQSQLDVDKLKQLYYEKDSKVKKKKGIYLHSV